MARWLFLALLCTALLVEASSPASPPPSPPPCDPEPRYMSGCSEKEQRTEMIIDFGFGIFGFFAFTGLINLVGIMYDRSKGRNKVADDS
jgi:hypothetical protein